MFLLRKNAFSTYFSIVLIITIISPMVLQPLQARASFGPIWNTQFDNDIDWIINTPFNVVIVGSNDKLYFLSELRGEQLWSIETGPPIKRTDVELIQGTDILLVNREIDPGKSFKLEAYEVLTGNKIWENDQIQGDGISVVPILEKWSFLYIIDKEPLKDQVLPHIYNINIFNGNISWENEFKKSFKGTKSSGILCFGDNRYDVSGFYPPDFIDDELYFFYDGIRKFDYNTGQQLWYAPYSVNRDESLLKLDGDAIITDNFIFTSASGIVRKINRKDGTVLWASETFGVIPLMYYDDNNIFAQIGGTFRKANFRDVDQISPVGVCAINTDTGKTNWTFYDCTEPITNIVMTDDKILFSDNVSLIALDKKTGKSAFKSTLDFENPVVTVADEINKRVIVQSGQRVASFNIDNGSKNWGIGFKEQKKGFFDIIPCRLLVGGAIILLTGGVATAIILGGYIAYDVHRSVRRNSADYRMNRQARAEQYYWENISTYRNTPGTLQADKIRTERLELISQQKNIYFCVYGEDEKNSDIQGVGGVNIDTGVMDFEVNLGNDKPPYLYDEVYGTIFYVDGNKIATYRLF